MDANVYNHLVSSYTPRTISKYDAHKPSELRSIVNKIVKITQTSPIYMIKLSDAKQSYALGIKEAAMRLKNSFNTLSEKAEDNLFNNKKAYSSDTSVIEAEFLEGAKDTNLEDISIRVAGLAKSQINNSNELYCTGKRVSGGTYKFQIGVADNVYDFQYNVKNDLNNEEIAKGLSSFINKAKIGLNAGIEYIGQNRDKFVISIESELTGSVGDDTIFYLRDKGEVGSHGIIKLLGLSNIVRKPESSTFYMDGIEKHTLSNEFSIGKNLKILLKKTSESEVDIRYFPDSEQILKNMEKLAGAYNYIIDSTEEYGKITKNRLRLANEMRDIIEPYRQELEACGFCFDEAGRISFDKALVTQAVNDEELEKQFREESSFVKTMKQKAEEIQLNPMDYVDKKIAVYPNYAKNGQGYCYITSLYSGLIFNDYC